uniref:Uncharacterized protein n=1 Tax=Trichuris muris TaxID=70415 RepID=A0A5S6QVX6_TRIMR
MGSDQPQISSSYLMRKSLLLHSGDPLTYADRYQGKKREPFARLRKGRFSTLCHQAESLTEEEGYHPVDLRAVCLGIPPPKLIQTLILMIRAKGFNDRSLPLSFLSAFTFISAQRSDRHSSMVSNREGELNASVKPNSQ